MVPVNNTSLVKIVLAEIFHYTETLSNVAGTNVAWSNNPETDANKYRQPNQPTFKIGLSSDQ